MKVLYISPGATAYIGIKDINNPSDIKKGKIIKIDFFMRHHSSYLGGGEYGKFGGMDITLLHLKTPVGSIYPPACLPTTAFPDSDRKANIAGYGRYSRKSCETDEYGPSKYHYCNSSCETNQNPPQEALCKEFFNNSVSKDLGTFQDIILDSGGEFTYCYRDKSPNLDSEGWCHVRTDASQLDSLQDTDSWGFCGKDCKNVTEPIFGVLREVDDIDILSENLCDTFLQSSLPKNGVKIKPQILCIGRIAHIDIKAFKVINKSFTLENSTQISHKSEFDPGKYFIKFSCKYVKKMLKLLKFFYSKQFNFWKSYHLSKCSF